MKKKFWTGRLKTILIVALIVAICAAVTLAITSGTSAIENVVGTILSPIRAGVASIDRLAERYYNYMFRYETLEAENAEMEKQILAMQEDIRDAEQLQRENEWLKALLKLSDEHEAVSYTHLDVYKRQAPNAAAQAMWARRCANASRNFAGRSRRRNLPRCSAPKALTDSGSICIRHSMTSG